MPTQEINEKPILMSTENVKAILEGRKTQTRRVIKKPERYDDIRQCDFCCPYGQVGDKLWVRETWCLDGDFGHGISKHPVYKASAHPNAGFTWRPSIHMPRWASRLTLEITEIRVERLQEISDDDVKAEGCELVGSWPSNNFRLLWDKINAKYGWSENPWVWVITFKERG